MKRADAARAGLVTLTVSALAGFVSSNASVLAYDARKGHGPIAGVGWPGVEQLSWAPAALAVMLFAVATWQLGFRGALIALVGFAIGGPILFNFLSPWSSEPAEGLMCCDGVRPLQAFSSSIAGFSVFLVIPAATVAVRRLWRRSRPVDTPERRPPAVVTDHRPAGASVRYDPGAIQLLVLLGWVPTGITAIISGVIIGFLTGNVGSALVVVVGGTLLGWIAMLVLAFTVGNFLEQEGLLRRAGVFEAISVVFGVVVTIAFAVQAV
jgi:hypothetical protein